MARILVVKLSKSEHYWPRYGDLCKFQFFDDFFLMIFFVIFFEKQGKKWIAGQKVAVVEK
jgi:hypothetical protein